MTDEIKNETNAAGQPDERIVMQIMMTKEGQLKVVSPIIADKAACYGILELAKDAIREAHKPQIIKPGGMLNFVRNGKH